MTDTDTIRVIVKSDLDEANIAKEKLVIKGYQTTLTEASNAVLDGTDIGGHLDTLSKVGEAIYVIIGVK